jgi:hypothetical protein
MRQCSWQVGMGRQHFSETFRRLSIFINYSQIALAILKSKESLGNVFDHQKIFF